MNWYVSVLKNYVGFQGRARREEYWMFVLVNFGVTVVLSLLQALFGIDQVLTSIYGLAVFLPTLAVGARRLHDTGRSGWWLLLNLIPLVGTIILIVFLVQDSQFGNNRYGANPKEKF
ncbi:DUF805 domain-containing protein [Paenibacillus sp. P96]|uniref:DUF805 domain-containing protein n=1 Tax=Paenibacillus zeirhizosphaerae TaxID=2987519 RepID=A0ABT9FP91_9BACL|nr:DUF805 domain-containing protein [Paenibacillus sp. P96]MDP4096326.1 DUF805 domain-containing protein [Paenibacillus sp. P96]